MGSFIRAFCGSAAWRGFRLCLGWLALGGGWFGVFLAFWFWGCCGFRSSRLGCGFPAAGVAYCSPAFMRCLLGGGSYVPKPCKNVVFFKGFGCFPTGAKKCTNCPTTGSRLDPDWIRTGFPENYSTFHFPHLFPTFRTLPHTTPPQTPSPGCKILRCTCGILWFCSVSEAELAGRKQVASSWEFPSYVCSLVAMS